MSTTDRSDDVAEAARVRSLRRRLEQLNVAANSGDPTALANLRKFIDEHPELVESCGDLAKFAEKVWIEQVVGTDAFTLETVTRMTEQMKADLAGPDADPLERWLVAHVAVAHLAERHAEIRAARDDGSLELAAFRLKRAESAQRRYLAAIKALSSLRALMPSGVKPGEPLRLFQAPREKMG